MSLLSAYLVAYGVVALSHLGIQLLFGHLDYRRQGGCRSIPAGPPPSPS